VAETINDTPGNCPAGFASLVGKVGIFFLAIFSQSDDFLTEAAMILIAKFGNIHFPSQRCTLDLGVTTQTPRGSVILRSEATKNLDLIACYTSQDEILRSLRSLRMTGLGSYDLGLVKANDVFLVHTLLNLRVWIKFGSHWHHAPIAVQVTYTNFGNFKAGLSTNLGQAG
jgi:hypothetical protein